MAHLPGPKPQGRSQRRSWKDGKSQRTASYHDVREDSELHTGEISTDKTCILTTPVEFANMIGGQESLKVPLPNRELQIVKTGTDRESQFYPEMSFLTD